MLVAIGALLSVVAIAGLIVVGVRRRKHRWLRWATDASGTPLPPVLPGYSWVSAQATPSDISPALTLYEVVALRNNQTAAFTMINPSKLARQSIDQQALEERLAVAQTINHPHCASVLGSNVRAPIPYFIEEWLGGGSLQDWLNKSDKDELMTDDELATVMGQVCDGLAYLHANNIVHGVLTPAHIRFDDQGQAHIVHCGFARLVSDIKPIANNDVAMITRSDLYALGIIAYQIATGRLPFEHGKFWSVQQGKQAIPDPRTLNPAISDASAQAILKSLHHDPAQRFQNAHDMASAFGFGQAFHLTHDATRILQLSQADQKTAKKTPYSSSRRPAPFGPLKLYNTTTRRLITITPPRAIATRDLINPADNLISRTNGEFVCENYTWFLGEAAAMQSTNGVYINDTRVLEPHPLYVGDKIRLGQTVLTVHG
jgi:serine/threonine protein kinase